MTDKNVYFDGTGTYEELVQAISQCLKECDDTLDDIEYGHENTPLNFAEQMLESKAFTLTWINGRMLAFLGQLDKRLKKLEAKENNQ